MNHFPNFPKKRPELPSAYQAIYEKNYQDNRDGNTTASSASQKVEAWMHRKVAQDLSQSQTHSLETLEIGAGNLNQLNYENGHKAYDVVEPQPFLYQNSPHQNQVRNFYGDIADIPKDQLYDRIVSIAAFEHICNLPEVVKAVHGHLKEDGRLRVAIPSEGGFLWALGWRMTTGLEFLLRYKLDYGVLMKYEHVNSADEIESILRHYFPKIEQQYYGVGKHLSLYQFFECRKK